MPRTSEGRPRRRMTEEVDELLSSRKTERKTQGWGAVAKRQADIAEKREAAENSVRDFWLKPD